MNKAAKAARYLLGLIFLVFGLNGFLNFLPIPPPPSGAAGAFMGGLAATGYMFPMIKATEVLGGILLLTGFMFPLAQILLAPITINIFLYHLILDGSVEGMMVPLVIVICQLILGYAHFNRFKPLFSRA